MNAVEINQYIHLNILNNKSSYYTNINTMYLTIILVSEEVL